jgi:hypothetical protein
MTKLQTAAGVAAILLLSNGSAAAQVSKDFIGVWGLDPEQSEQFAEMQESGLGSA